MSADDSSKHALRAALSLIRRLPPASIPKHLAAVLHLRPDLTETLLQRVDQPLAARLDARAGRQYLLCDFNRDADSYRSPWSNTYDPPLEVEEGAPLEDAGFFPSEPLRELEVSANEMLDVYRELYYDPARSVSSVYMWDLPTGFASCWLIKSTVEGGNDMSKGSWDAIHVIEATRSTTTPGATSYKLTSTVMLSLGMRQEKGVGVADFSGSVTKQATTDSSSGDHIACMGTMIEAMESELRGALDTLYLSKMGEIVGALHVKAGAAAAASSGFSADLSAAVLRRAGGASH